MNDDGRGWRREPPHPRPSAFLCGFYLFSALARIGPAEAGGKERRDRVPVEVRSVRPRPLENGLRLEIGLSAPAEFRWGRLRHPDRVYVDVIGARLVGMPYELRVGAGGVDRLWARQNAADTVRVVAGLTERVEPTASRAESGDAIYLDLRPSDDEGSDRASVPAPRVAPGLSQSSRASSHEPRATSHEPLPPLTITEPHFPPPAATDPASVTDLDARNLSTDAAEIRVRTGQRMSYKPIRLDNPARYVVDLPGGRDGLFCTPLVQGEGLLGLRDVRVSQFTRNPPVFRVVVDLPKGAWAEARADDSGEVVVEVTRRHSSKQARRKGGERTGKDRTDALLVGIDPGHGGSDPGAMPMVGMPEKDITLDVALRVRDLLERAGVATAMTRRDDRRLQPKERIRFVQRADLDLFLSIHCDSAETRSATGVTTYVHGWGRKSRAMAMAIQRELVRVTGLPDRGVRGDTDLYDTGFYVLRKAVPPAVLIEAGYVSHPATALRLSYPEFRQRVAQGIVAGLQKYWKSGGKAGTLRVAVESNRS